MKTGYKINRGKKNPLYLDMFYLLGKIILSKFPAKIIFVNTPEKNYRFSTQFYL